MERPYKGFTHGLKTIEDNTYEEEKIRKGKKLSQAQCEPIWQKNTYKCIEI